jgi:hypothetical protein
MPAKNGVTGLRGSTTFERRSTKPSTNGAMSLKGYSKVSSADRRLNLWTTALASDPGELCCWIAFNVFLHDVMHGAAKLAVERDCRCRCQRFYIAADCAFIHLDTNRVNLGSGFTNSIPRLPLMSFHTSSAGAVTVFFSPGSAKLSVKDLTLGHGR